MKEKSYTDLRYFCWNILLFIVNILTKAYLFYSVKPCRDLQNYARHESNKNNFAISNLHSFQQVRVAQLVEHLDLDPEARVRIPVEVNFLNK
jgi:hypothetical protein